MKTDGPEALTQAALLQALARLLAPIARLAVARGLNFGAVEELLKKAFVDAGRAAQPAANPRDISRVATATGLTRREVTRLSQQTRARAPARLRLSPATQIFTSWLGDRKLRDRHGAPKALPRQGPAPSFEALANSVTTDVHARSLLDELVRLGVARYDLDSDTVSLIEQAFVPRDDQERMLALFGANVGDHLSAGVANVLNEQRRHFEQAVFANELSDESITAATRLVNAQWRALMAALVPELEAMVEADRQAAARDRAHAANRRLRIGLYAFDAPIADDDTQER